MASLQYLKSLLLTNDLSLNFCYRLTNELQILLLISKTLVIEICILQSCRFNRVYSKQKITLMLKLRKCRDFT